MLKKHQRFAVLIYILLCCGFVIGIGFALTKSAFLGIIGMGIGGFIAGVYSSKMLEWCMRGI